MQSSVKPCKRHSREGGNPADGTGCPIKNFGLDRTIVIRAFLLTNCSRSDVAAEAKCFT